MDAWHAGADHGDQSGSAEEGSRYSVRMSHHRKVPCSDIASRLPRDVPRSPSASSFPGLFVPSQTPEASRCSLPSSGGYCATRGVGVLHDVDTIGASVFSCFAALVLAPWAQALLLQIPVDWQSSSPANISWTNTASDPPFTLELVNTDEFHDTFGIANNLNPSADFASFTLPVIPQGYVLPSHPHYVYLRIQST